MPNPEEKTANRAVAIAAALAGSSPGDKAETRRMSVDGSAFFWRQLATQGISAVQEGRWLLYTRLIALLTPASRDVSIHHPGRALGAALAAAGLSEQRFARLLAARGAARDDALERAIRMAARKIDGLDVVDLAWFILRPEGTARMARSYYHHLDGTRTEEPSHV